MKNILQKYERNFLVCGDCAFFNATEIIDERYPQIKKGKCIKHNKIVDNFKETECTDNTGNYKCNMCIHFKENKWFDDAKNIYGDDYPFECSFKSVPRDEDSEPCEYFSLYDN